MSAHSLQYPMLSSCSLLLHSPPAPIEVSGLLTVELGQPSGLSNLHDFSSYTAILENCSAFANSLAAIEASRAARKAERAAAAELLLVEEARQAEAREKERREAAAKAEEARMKIDQEQQKLEEIRAAYEKQMAALTAMQQTLQPSHSPLSQPPQASPELRQFAELTGVKEDEKAAELLRLVGNDLNHAIQLFYSESEDPNVLAAIEKAKLLSQNQQNRQAAVASPAVSLPLPLPQTHNIGHGPLSHPISPVVSDPRVALTFVLPDSVHLVGEFSCSDTFWTLVEFLYAHRPDVASKNFRFQHVATGAIYSEQQYNGTLREAGVHNAPMLKVVL